MLNANEVKGDCVKSEAFLLSFFKTKSQISLKFV